MGVRGSEHKIAIWTRQGSPTAEVKNNFRTLSNYFKNMNIKECINVLLAFGQASNLMKNLEKATGN